MKMHIDTTRIRICQVMFSILIAIPDFGISSLP